MNLIEEFNAIEKNWNVEWRKNEVRSLDWTLNKMELII